MSNRKVLIPLALTVLVVGILAAYVAGLPFRKDRANSEGFDLEALRRVPVLEGGRVKPLDTVARTTLRMINKSDEYEDAERQSQPAIKWLADVMFMGQPQSGESFQSRTGPAWQAKIFRIENEQLVLQLGLPIRPGLRYALAEFYDRRNTLVGEAEKAEKVPEKKRNPYQVKVLELAKYLSQIERVAAFHVTLIPPQADGEGWHSVHDRHRAILDSKDWANEARLAARENILKRHNLDDAKLEALDQAQLTDLAKRLDPEIREELDKQLKKVQQAVDAALAADPLARPWIELRNAYQAGDHQRFNELIATLSQPAETVPSKAVQKLPTEILFNKMRPFLQAEVMYIIAVVLALVGLILFAFDPKWSRLGRWPALGVMSFALCIHTAGLITRMYLQERPPVTNLYSSAVFIGWGAVLTCIIVELVFSYGVSTIVGGALGFGTCLIAHFLSLNTGDTLEMMQAVLDTNFWLATHVVLVTFGYVATYVAGVFALAFIALGMLTPLLNRKFFQDLSNIIYGVVCLAMMLSFIGTVLGGIWADQSWGRFWGWDPKENGAVLVVIWNAIILHARWAGLVQQRGMAVLAVLGNIVTTWSWFGTNMLGVGLHAYGFSTFGYWLMIGVTTVGLTVSLVATIIHPRYWMSYGGRYDPGVKDAIPADDAESRPEVPCATLS